MARPEVKKRYAVERQALAQCINAALKAGHRASGTSRRPWSAIEFAKAVGQDPACIRKWRDQNDPERPVSLIQVLEVLYGNNPAHAGPRRSMHQAWKRAAGIEDDDPPEQREIVEIPFSEVANVVTLVANQPTPDNHGNLLVPYTLRTHCDERVAIEIIKNGKPLTVFMDIGLTKPLFLVESKDWQPLQDTIFRARPHKHTAPGPIADSVYLTGPMDGMGPIVGDPLEGELHVVMERRGTEQDGPINLCVKATRDGLHVTVGDAALSATQNDVLDAIFAEAIPRDPRNRLEIASVVVKPAASKDRD